MNCRWTRLKGTSRSADESLTTQVITAWPGLLVSSVSSSTSLRARAMVPGYGPERRFHYQIVRVLTLHSLDHKVGQQEATESAPGDTESATTDPGQQQQRPSAYVGSRGLTCSWLPCPSLPGKWRRLSSPWCVGHSRLYAGESRPAGMDSGVGQMPRRVAARLMDAVAPRMGPP